MVEEDIKAIESRHLTLSVSNCDNVSSLAAALRQANATIAVVRMHTAFHESLADECERGNGGEYAVGRAEGIRDYARDINAALAKIRNV